MFVCCSVEHNLGSIIFKNLNEYSDENRLLNEIFNSNIFNNWALSDYNLYLYLDGLDECILPTVSTKIGLGLSRA